MTIESEKFQDSSTYLDEFADEFLIVCPSCERQARVVLSEPTQFDHAPHLFASRKLVCPFCGYYKKQSNGPAVTFSSQKEVTNNVVIGGSFDWYFQQPLWLQSECCGEVLWAYNEKHLAFLRQYVAAKLRSRVPNINKSMVSRLPKWMKSAKNREAILRAIDNLFQKLNENS